MYSHVCNRQTNDIKGNVQRLWFSTENQLKSVCSMENSGMNAYILSKSQSMYSIEFCGIQLNNQWNTKLMF